MFLTFLDLNDLDCEKRRHLMRGSAVQQPFQLAAASAGEALASGDIRACGDTSKLESLLYY